VTRRSTALAVVGATPQFANRARLRAAHTEACAMIGRRDRRCALLERQRFVTSSWVESPVENMKVTHPVDLVRAEPCPRAHPIVIGRRRVFWSNFREPQAVDALFGAGVAFPRTSTASIAICRTRSRSARMRVPMRCGGFGPAARAGG